MIHNWEEQGIRVEKARWGRSNIIKGKLRLNFQKTLILQKITLEDAKKRLEEKQPKKKKQLQNEKRKSK